MWSGTLGGVFVSLATGRKPVSTIVNIFLEVEVTWSWVCAHWPAFWSTPATEDRLLETGSFEQIFSHSS